MDLDRFSADLLKSLAHPARLRILRTLQADGESCVCHLETRLGLRQAYLSQQLARLRESGLVQDRREGLNVFYTLADADLEQLLGLIQESARSIAERAEIKLNRSETAVGTLTACPCPRCQNITLFSPRL